MVERIVLGAVTLGCLAAALLWGRSSRRLLRAWRRVAQGQGDGTDAAFLARASFDKDLHTALLYGLFPLRALAILIFGRSLYYLPFLVVFAPIGISFRNASRF